MTNSGGNQPDIRRWTLGTIEETTEEERRARDLGRNQQEDGLDDCCQQGTPPG